MSLCIPYIAIVFVMPLKLSADLGIILGMGSNNERRRFCATPPFAGQAHTHNDPQASMEHR